MFEHVLVAIDFSSAWPLLRDRLAGLHSLGARRATLVHVQESRYPAAPAVTHQAHYQERLEEESRSVAEFGLQTAFELHTGSPGRELTDIARRINADLLLVGSHGHGRMHDLLLGSTALDTARLTRTPLWLEPIVENPISDHRTLLLATDGSDQAANAERLFVELVEHFQRKVALRVVRDAEHSDGERVDAEQQLKTLAGQVTGLETLIEAGDPRRLVSERARSLPADLTVLGKRGRSAIGELLLGSTAEAVCHRAHRPVLLVPGSERKD